MPCAHCVVSCTSSYNFKAKQKGSLPPAEQLVGEKLPDHVKFHLHLSRMAKTNVRDPAEIALIGRIVPRPRRMKNPVFLYEVTQPFDSQDGRDTQYRIDLTNFLGLNETLRPIKSRPPTESRNYHYAIDICDDKFQQLRTELVQVGINASKWIREYFMAHRSVTVSSPGHFRELLLSWATDPCDSK